MEVLLFCMIAGICLRTAKRNGGRQLAFWEEEAVVAAANMEMGGFDITVGEGMAEEFYSGWQEEAGGDNSASDDSAETSEDTIGGNDFGENYELDTAGKEEAVYHSGDTMDERESDCQTPGNFSDVSEEADAESISDRWEDSAPNVLQETGQGSVQTMVQSPDTVPEITPTSVIDHADITASTQQVKNYLPSPTPVQKEAEPDNTEVPELLFYNKNGDQERKRTPLQIYHRKETASSCKSMQFQIIAQCPVHILSVRINQKECLWHREEDLLILDGAAEKKQNSIELIALYEAGETIRIVFQNGISS